MAKFSILSRYLRIAYVRMTLFTCGLNTTGRQRLMGFYRLWAPFYDWTCWLDPGYSRGLQRMVELTVDPNDHCIDIGAGTGLATVKAARRAKRVVAVDPSQAMLKRLHRKVVQLNLVNVDVRAGFLSDVVKPRETFECAISSFMLVHLSLEQRTALLREVGRLLKPGGKIGLFAAQGEVARCFQTSDEIIKELSNAGFHRIIVEGISDVYQLAQAEKP